MYRCPAREWACRSVLVGSVRPGQHGVLMPVCVCAFLCVGCCWKQFHSMLLWLHPSCLQRQGETLLTSHALYYVTSHTWSVSVCHYPLVTYVVGGDEVSDDSAGLMTWRHEVIPHMEWYVTLHLEWCGDLCNAIHC